MDDFFIDHKPCKIDAKDRISIPASMRPLLGEEFIASRGVKNSIALYPMEVWRKMVNDIMSKANQKNRRILELYFSANAERLSLDGQGRLKLNERLKEHAGLVGEKQAEIFGNNDKIEIWNCALFSKELEAVENVNISDLLDECGI